MNTKKWWQSKFVWLGLITTVLGILPLINIYVKVIDPQVATIADATMALIAGILTIIVRVWIPGEPTSINKTLL